MAAGRRDRLAALLTTGPVWGAELDTRYCVLAVTVEPTADVHPGGEVADRRLQVVFHPVSRIAASLVEDREDGPAVLRFSEDQLPDIIAALDGAVAGGEVFPDEPTLLQSLGDRLSMGGTAQVPDGRSHHLHLHLVAAELVFDLFASYDEVEVRDPEGHTLRV